MPAGICDGWLHCNIQIACHLYGYENIKQNQDIKIGGSERAYLRRH
jgi:hypothetical protein